MSCTLTILGKTLDVDEFVKTTGITGFKKKHKGDLISVARNKKLEYSYASIVTSEAGFDNLGLQVKETEEFLIKYKESLKFIADMKEIDFATINFGISSTITGINMAQEFFFPPSLLLLCSELKLGLELTVYSF